jgi:hypothetical protein
MRHNVSTQIKKDGGFLNQIYKTFINLNYISYSPEIEEEFEYYNTLFKLLKNKASPFSSLNVLLIFLNLLIFHV